MPGQESFTFTDEQINALIQDLREEYEALSEDGFRVLAIAYKDPPLRTAYSKEDESELVLKGYVAFARHYGFEPVACRTTRSSRQVPARARTE